MMTLEEVLEPPALPATGLGVAVETGPLTYAGNRVLIATRAKPAGTYRIGVIGDSMGYGAGLPYRKAFSARLSTHLNSAVPEWWVECVSFGVSGACIHHASGRALTHALPADADLVIIAVCCNDAYLLGPQPSDLAVLGAQWISFAPLVRRSLRAVRDAAAAFGRRVMVVYLDKLIQAGDVCVPAELGAACAEVGLPFVDGSSVLTGYQQVDLMVSTADGHLSALAYDVIARHVTQAIVSQGLLPRSAGFDDPSWIDAIEHGGQARVAAGLTGPLAYGEALTVIEAKWLNRRNTKRRQFEGRYAAARQRLLDRQRTSLARLAYGALQERLRITHPIVVMWQVEMWANGLMAIAFAVEHLLDVSTSDDVLANLGHLHEEEAEPVTLPISMARWERIRDSVAAVQRSLHESAALQADQDAGDLDYLRLWRSRISQWLQVVEQCADRFLDLLPRFAPPLDAHGARLLAYVERRAPGIQNKVTELAGLADEILIAGRDAARAAGAGWLTLELVLSASPGPEPWTFTAGMESVTPAFSERQIGTGYFIRDAEPHVYELDLPVTLSGNIHVYVEGTGLRARGGGFRVHKALLKWPQGGLAPVTLPAPILEASTEISASMVFRVVSTLPKAAAPL